MWVNQPEEQGPCNQQTTVIFPASAINTIIAHNIFSLCRCAKGQLYGILGMDHAGDTADGTADHQGLEGGESWSSQERVAQYCANSVLDGQRFRCFIQADGMRCPLNHRVRALLPLKICPVTIP